ncbi:MAG: DUF5606 domain-containing protein [Paludibacteraceae bacterium]|nr:DUF5606 domain-containing protein [Paludibacteraceae bacterium]
MLKKILAITGKSGLYKLISHNNNVVIVESLETGKRFPSYPSDKIVSLNDVSMFTETDDIALREVLKMMFDLEKGAVCSVDPKADGSVLREYFAKVLPNFDRDRVHNSDIKKLIQWYNLLVKSDNTNFEEEEEKKS